MKRSTVVVTDLEADDNFGLGITVSELHGVGIFVKSLMRNGPAERDGRLRIGDHINSVAGHSLEGATEADADWLIQQLRGCVRIVASRPSSWKSDLELCSDRLSDCSRDYVFNFELNSVRRESSDNGILHHPMVNSSDLDLDTIESPELQVLPTHDMIFTGSPVTAAECHRQTAGW